MEEKSIEKITRAHLRAMTDGDTIAVQCANGLELDSQKNTAYFMQKIEGCRYSCKSEGLKLSVTRHPATN